MSKRMFEAAWSEFSRRAAEQVRVEHGDPKAGVRYYAEKHRDTRMIDLGELPPTCGCWSSCAIPATCTSRFTPSTPSGRVRAGLHS